MSAIQQMLGSYGTTPPGQIVYSVPGTYEWIVPQGVIFISAVGVSGGGAGDNGNNGDGGGGGGAGGKLAYANGIAVTPGQTCIIQVGFGGSNISNNSFNAKASDGTTTSLTFGSTVITIPGGQGGSPYAAAPRGYRYC